MRTRADAIPTDWVARVVVAAIVEVIGTGITALSALNDKQPHRPMDAAGYGLLIVASGLTALPRRWQVEAYLVALLATVTYAWAGYSTHSPYFVGLLAAAYVAGAPGQRLRTVVLATAGFGAFAVEAIGAPGPDALGNLFFGVLVAGALGVGQVVTELRAATERRLDQARESEAQRRMTDERLRIARDLHDVISHSIAMINVQAGVAAHIIEQRPDEALKSLLAIKQASGDALRDLRGILGLLRDADDESPRIPAARLDQLSGLVDNVRAAGLKAELIVDGSVDGLPAGADLAGYRVVQEALTNVIRHAPGSSVRVSVRRGPDALELTIEDDGPAVANARIEGRQGTGHGLDGIRERVRAAGGTVDFGPRAAGGFRVRAQLPLEAEPA